MPAAGPSTAAAAGVALALVLARRAVADDSLYSATYLPNTLPNQTEGTDQFGENTCSQWGSSSQDSLCQTLYMNSLEDFCLWGPPFSDGQNATIAVTERIEVAYCIKDGYGTRLIPDGTITAAHFVKTDSYIQITGEGDFTKIGIPAGDLGGELDPHGYDGKGNPIGGVVFSNAYNGSATTFVQMHEWSIYIGATSFCAKVCLDGGDSDNLTGARQLCPHIYDEMGCNWVMPGNYAPNVFESCDGAVGQPAGIEGVSPNYSTFTQGQPNTPSAKPIPPSSNCQTITSVPTNGAAAFTPAAGVAVNGSNAGGKGATQTAGSKSGGDDSAAAPVAHLAMPALVALTGVVLGALAVL